MNITEYKSNCREISISNTSVFVHGKIVTVMLIGRINDKRSSIILI